MFILRLVLYIVLVVAHFAIGKKPNGNNGQDEKSDYNTENCHNLKSLTPKSNAITLIICKLKVKY